MKYYDFGAFLRVPLYCKSINTIQKYFFCIKIAFLFLFWVKDSFLLRIYKILFWLFKSYLSMEFWWKIPWRFVCRRTATISTKKWKWEKPLFREGSFRLRRHLRCVSQNNEPGFLNWPREVQSPGTMRYSTLCMQITSIKTIGS